MCAYTIYPVLSSAIQWCAHTEIVCNLPCKISPAARAGFVQRFTIGFRGPLCLVSGFSGVTLSDFAIGASIGACITMSIQLALVSFHQLQACRAYLEVHAGLRG